MKLGKLLTEARKLVIIEGLPVLQQLPPHSTPPKGSKPGARKLALLLQQAYVKRGWSLKLSFDDGFIIGKLVHGEAGEPIDLIVFLDDSKVFIVDNDDWEGLDIRQVMTDHSINYYAISDVDQFAIDTIVNEPAP